MESPATHRETAQQAELPGMAEACVAVGLAAMPAGFAKLTRRQRLFVVGFLDTGNATDSARNAGYSDPESDGSKVQKHPEVAAILAQAGVEVAKNADQLVKRAGLRSLALHAEFTAELTKPAGIRNQASLLKLAAAVDKTDGLLGSLLGKISGLHGTLDVNHHNLGALTVPAAALGDLAQMRRDALKDQLAIAQGGTN